MMDESWVLIVFLLSFVIAINIILIFDIKKGVNLMSEPIGVILFAFGVGACGLNELLGLMLICFSTLFLIIASME